MKLLLATPFFLSIIAAQDLPNGIYQRGHPYGAGDATHVAAKRNASDALSVPACVQQAGNGPHVLPDTDVSFLKSAAFSHAAKSAAANPPARYAVAAGWVDLKASNGGDNTGYLGFAQSELSGYSPQQCAELCSNWPEHSAPAGAPCASFVIYYERHPALVSPTTKAPSPAKCPASASSPSVTLVKCAFYSVPLHAGNATNAGQYQDGFHVVIAGSTAFNLEAPSLRGYTAPVALHNASLDVPPPAAKHGYISVQTFPGAAADGGAGIAHVCADKCASTPPSNLVRGGPEALCTSFNVYRVYKKGADSVLTCAYYSTNYGASYATNVGQYDSAGNHYTIGNSYSYYRVGSPAPLEKDGPKFKA